MDHQEATKPKTTYKINKNIFYEVIDNNYIILDIFSGEYYELSESASMIWKEVLQHNSGFTIEDITNNFQAMFKEPSVKEDIQELFKEFYKLKIIEKIDDK